MRAEHQRTSVHRSALEINEGISMKPGTWKCVKKVAKFQVRTPGRGSPFVFANGKHQAAIDIVFESYDAEGRYLDISPDELFRWIELIDAETGERLGQHRSTGWVCSCSCSEYPLLQKVDNEISAVDVHDLSSNANLRLYLTTLIEGCVQVAAQVSLADGSRLSTRDESLADGFKCALVTAKIIDYSNPYIWKMYSFNEFRPMADDVPCYEMQTAHSWTKKFHCKTAFNRIRIELLLSPNIEIFVNEVPDSKQRVAATDASAGMSTGAGVNAYAAHNWGDRLDVVSWFISPRQSCGFRSGEILLASTIFLIGSLYKVEIDQNDQRSVVDPYPLEKNGFDVYVCRLTIPISRLTQFGWENYLGIRKVYLYDKYGNDGTLKLDFSYDQIVPFPRE
ncbi:MULTISPECIES: hypothetical protein [unclassified Caballeronia]|uniref:hypothetical protein n=1 Tax=unclassified Caballeronia TaxID=2646786 RepID=UPI00285AB2DD|nr:MULTISPECIES: hypothetical protein [unclassified Caballeronia]MDR5771507.1 hypothetical protein [Caballeronia sp. LZ002]MDR5800071.1 hypothetical protein [Caballeronia sp. LZ001]MDR5805269.1 hypothetical protein [Caballeronia sp. LZ001]MDR5846943.1 hypothetical protein [Caballeronia sp. LZ003]